MIDPAGDASHWLLIGGGTVIGAGALLSLVRVLKGPSLADRVVALDLLGFLVVAVLCIDALVTRRPSILAVALVASLILFLGTTAFAISLERRRSD